MQDENDIDFEMPEDDSDHSDYDDVLSEISPDEDHDDDESHDDESGEDDSTNETVSQQTKKPSRWKRKVNYLTEQKLRAEQLAREREMVLVQKMAELETKDKFIQSLFQSATGEPQTNTNFTQQDAFAASAPSVATKAINSEDIDRIVKERTQKFLTESMQAQAKNEKLANKWNPQIARMRKELEKEPAKANAFIDWFSNYIADVDSDSTKRALLGVAGDLEYAAETIYTVGKHPQFKNLPLEDQIPAMLKLHADIAAKRKKTTGADKSIERPRGSGSPAKNWKEMSVEDHVKQKLMGKK